MGIGEIGRGPDRGHVMADGFFLASQIPKHGAEMVLQLFGAGREKRIYAIPPYTDVASLDFDDHPFEVPRQGHACALCGSTDSYLDETAQDDGRLRWTCSDTDWCARRRGA